MCNGSIYIHPVQVHYNPLPNLSLVGIMRVYIPKLVGEYEEASK